MGLDTFVLLCRAHKLPDPVAEFRFHPKRRWRFDYAFVPALVAVEVEGAVFTQGRHTRGAGVLKDMAKYNTAAVDGWCILRFTPQQVKAGDFIPTLRCALERRWVQQPMEPHER